MKKLIAPILSAVLSAAVLILSIPYGIGTYACLQIILSIASSALLLLSLAWRGCSIAAICISAPMFLTELWLMVARDFVTLSAAMPKGLDSPVAWTVLCLHFGIVGCCIAQCSALYSAEKNKY